MKSKLALALLASLCLAMEQDDVARHKEWMDTAQDVKDDSKDGMPVRRIALLASNSAANKWWAMAGAPIASRPRIPTAKTIFVAFMYSLLAGNQIFRQHTPLF
jgi:hypothetical protein